MSTVCFDHIHLQLHTPNPPVPPTSFYMLCPEFLTINNSPSLNSAAHLHMRIRSVTGVYLEKIGSFYPSCLLPPPAPQTGLGFGNSSSHPRKCWLRGFCEGTTDAVSLCLRQPCQGPEDTLEQQFSPTSMVLTHSNLYTENVLQISTLMRLHL